MVTPTSARDSGPFVLAIGDSLAAGDQPDAATGADRPTGAGYINVLARRLGRVYPGLSAIKLSCGGATTTSIMSSSNCRGRRGSQLSQAETFLQQHRGQVKLVTIDVGDNDVERCIHAAGSIDNDCVGRGRATISANLPKVVAGIQQAAGPGVAVIGVVDYDQYLGRWVSGRAGRSFARRSIPVIVSLNGLMSSVYRHAGVAVADGGVKFSTTDLRDRRRLPGYGVVPLDVQRVCRWTWACSGPPIGFDDHAKPAGYDQLAQAVLDAMRSGARSAAHR